MLETLRKTLTHPVIFAAALLLPLMFAVLLKGGVPDGLSADEIDRWSPYQEPGRATLAMAGALQGMFFPPNPNLPAWFNQEDLWTLQQFKDSVGSGDTATAAGHMMVLAGRVEEAGEGSGAFWSMLVPLMLSQMIVANFGPVVLAAVGTIAVAVFCLPWILRRPSDALRWLAALCMSATALVGLFALGYALGGRFGTVYGGIEYLAAATLLFGLGQIVRLAALGQERMERKAARDPLARVAAARNSNARNAPRAAAVSNGATLSGRSDSMAVGTPRGGKPWNPYDLPVGQDFRENARDYARMRTSLNGGTRASVDVNDDADARVVHLRSVAELRQERARAASQAEGPAADLPMPAMPAQSEPPAIIGGPDDMSELPAGTLDPATGLPAHLVAAARQGFDLRGGFDPQVVATMAAAAAAASIRSASTAADRYAERLAPAADTPMPSTDWMSGVLGTVRPSGEAAPAAPVAEDPDRELTAAEHMEMMLAMQVLGRIRPARPEPMEAIDEPDLPGAFHPPARSAVLHPQFAIDDVMEAPVSTEEGEGDAGSSSFLNKLGSIGRVGSR